MVNHDRLEELMYVPERISLIQTFTKPMPNFTHTQRKIIVNALDASVILSFCKAVEKNKKALNGELKRLGQENPKLLMKIEYIRKIRNKAVAHLDSDDVGKIFMKIEQAVLGTSLDEVTNSYNEILDWILEVLDIRSYFRAINGDGEPKVPNEVIEKIPLRQALDIYKKATEQTQNQSENIIKNVMEQTLKELQSHE